jgi:nickel/cobalt transporter (NicO) family protein
MNYGPALLLVAAVATVGVLHTIVPDHWVPITLIARQRGRSKSETARAALQAGAGHVLSTLAKQRTPNFAEPVLAGRIKCWIHETSCAMISDRLLFPNPRYANTF